MTVRQDGVTIADSSLVVLESEPYRRLAYTWYPFMPKCADDHGLSDEDRAHAIRECRSTMIFDIEPLGQLVKLTVVQGGFEPESPLLESVTHGWPLILSGLKTLLETDELLPALSDAASVTP
jgi:Activator of Hsp90 ATPase homolog 1-like protein